MRNYSKKPSKAELHKKQAEAKEEERADNYGVFFLKPRRYGCRYADNMFKNYPNLYCNTCLKDLKGCGLLEKMVHTGHDIVNIEDTDYEQVNLLNP